VYGDNPSPLVSARLSARSAVRQSVEAELNRLERMAAAAEPLTPRNLGWAALPSESGLTEAQEDFIDYWSPQRVIDDCQAKRVLIARTFDHQRFEDLAEDPAGQLNELLRALVSGRLTAD
jgi:hypothetical protein